jgi:hypothetical protein
MARVLVAAQVAPGAYPVVTANSRDLAMQAADPSLKNYTPLVEGKTLLIAQNTDSGAHTVTITSIVDAFNRTGDVTAYSLGAGELAIFGPFKEAGWKHLDTGEVGIWFEANDATVKFAVVTQA